MASTPGDHNKASNEFFQEIRAQKAKELGVEPDQITQKVVNGQTVWVKKTEVYADLEKQRNIASNRVIRAIRGGENSLFGRILQLGNESRSLLRTSKQYEWLNALQSHDLQVSISNLEQRSQEAADQLAEIEDAIESAKSRDSVFAEGEQALYQIRDAQRDGNKKQVLEIQRAHQELLRKYQKRRKSIEPYLQSARTYRAVLQKQMLKACLLVWDLRSEYLSGIKKHIEELSQQTGDEDAKQNKNVDLKKMETDLHALQSAYRKRKSIALDTSNESDHPSEAWDAGIYEMIELLDRQRAVQPEFEKLLHQYHQAGQPDQEKGPRMSYWQRK